MLTKQQRINFYTKLACHPKFNQLPAYLQDALTYMAAGATDKELSKFYKISHGTPWAYRESIFKRYGFKVYEPDRINKHTYGPTRAMTAEEVAARLRL